MFSYFLNLTLNYDLYQAIDLNATFGKTKKPSFRKLVCLLIALSDLSNLNVNEFGVNLVYEFNR